MSFGGEITRVACFIHKELYEDHQQHCDGMLMPLDEVEVLKNRKKEGMFPHACSPTTFDESKLFNILLLKEVKCVRSWFYVLPS